MSLHGPAPSVVLRVRVRETRSHDRFIASALGIKSWIAKTPSCGAARPGSCPRCGAAAQPMGGRVVLVGHGLVERQVWGPLSFSDPAEGLVVKMRRYRCRACRAVLVVGPRGLVRRRWYGAGAIALALSMVAHGETSVAVRARMSPSRVVGSSAAERWITLSRWVEAARRGAIFGVTGLEGLERRRVAEAVMLALAARGGRQLGGDLAESAFVGASIAA